MRPCAPLHARAGRPMGDGPGMQLLNGSIFWQTALPRGCPALYLYRKGHGSPLSPSPPSPAQDSVHLFTFAKQIGRGSSQF